MKRKLQRWYDWLESNGAAPAFGGGVLLTIGLCFFGAATNTMAGWLYVISGLILALLILGAVLPMRSLKALQVQRQPITPVSVGDVISLDVQVTNPTTQPKALLQLIELLPKALGQPQPITIEAIAPQQTRTYTTTTQATQRGLYHWPGLFFRTGNPLGLFWCRRWRSLPAQVIIYPQILPLRRCPLIDTIQQNEQLNVQQEHRYQAATEGITKALRPYRFGDPTRLIHWRTSARLGNLQVRELEILTSGREVLIALDSHAVWSHDDFEQAVIAAASLYFYTSRAQLAVTLWTAATGTVQGNRVVLETLAAVQYQEALQFERPATMPLLWLTPSGQASSALPPGSLTLLFGSTSTQTTQTPTLVIERDRPLIEQLSQPIQFR
ncbi:DUF58 domain-containing protein [Spirulina major]|uniref:DUF58 domain-containing protein n=1 Tax=Spirulina major TaxID=270636 RepID=UPI00093276F6|nr:DUF58 domain-containing protein [Spirulina major]